MTAPPIGTASPQPDDRTPRVVTLRTPVELHAMREAGALAARVLAEARAASEPGVATRHIDALIASELARAGATSLFKGRAHESGPSPFPASSCISINHEVVHAVPGSRVIEAGDLVTIDVGLSLHGWCADSAVAFVAGGECCADRALVASREALRAATIEVLLGAIERARPGEHWLNIAAWMEQRASDLGYAIVTDFVGHGIGRELHEPPKAPAYLAGFVGTDFILEPGMVLAIEPILAQRDASSQPDEPPSGHLRRLGAQRCAVRTAPDGWTVVTRSGVDACHAEHTVAITANGPWVLTDRGSSANGGE